MNIPEKYKEGILYILIGLFFFLATIDILFPIVIFTIKCLFYIIGGLLIIGGIIELKDNFKTKKTDEN